MIRVPADCIYVFCVFCLNIAGESVFFRRSSDLQWVYFFFFWLFYSILDQSSQWFFMDNCPTNLKGGMGDILKLSSKKLNTVYVNIHIYTHTQNVHLMK